MRLEVDHQFPVGLREGFDYITDQANWPEYWPGLVRIEPRSRWGEPGDVTRLVVRLLNREVPVEMTLRRFEPYRLVEYTSTQPGVPDAHHERQFEDAGGKLHYRIAVELEPRRGLRGLHDRILVRRGIACALNTTVANLDAVFGASKLKPL